MIMTTTYKRPHNKMRAIPNHSFTAGTSALKRNEAPSIPKHSMSMDIYMPLFMIIIKLLVQETNVTSMWTNLMKTSTHQAQSDLCDQLQYTQISVITWDNNQHMHYTRIHIADFIKRS